MFGLLVLAFIAGLLTFLAPCTLPVLPAYLAFAAVPDRKRAVLRTLAFGVGIATVFTLLGVLAGSLGSLIGTHKDIIARVAGGLFLIFGTLVLTGRELPGLRIEKNTGRTFTGALVAGIIFAIAWSGCIGPIVGFALVLAAQTQTAALGGVILFMYAVGLITPLLIVSTFLDTLKGGPTLRFLRGREVMIGGRAFHTTQLVTGIMLLIVGLIFLLRIDLLLAESPIIGWLFQVEERIADALGIPLTIIG